MMAREFYYRGKTLEELKKMSVKELMDIMPSRIKRSLKKGFTDPQKILLKILTDSREGKSKKSIKTHCRDMIILPEMVGQSILVHNGKEFVNVVITGEMLGHYLGDFAHTRKKVSHSAPGIGATKSSAAASVK